MVPAISFFFALLQYLLTALHTNSNYFKKSIDKTSISAYNNRVLATIAQLAEHLIRNERVVGSNPISGSKTIRNSIVTAVGFFFLCYFLVCLFSNRNELSCPMLPHNVGAFVFQYVRLCFISVVIRHFVAFPSTLLFHGFQGYTFQY